MALISGVWKQITIKRNYKTTGYSATDGRVTFATVWGKVQLGNGREYYAAKQTIPELDGLIQLKQYIHGIGSDMVVYIDGQKYQIIAVKGIREQNFMELQIKK